jgi:hypothetical protein
MRGVGAGAGSPMPQMPPLPPGALPADAEKHAAALWSFLDELAEDPEAYQQFIEKQAQAAGVGDLDAFRTRLAGGAGASAAPPGPADVVAAAEALLADTGKALPADLVARLASLGCGGGAVRAAPAAAPAAAAPPRRAPLVQELTPDEVRHGSA